MPLESRYKLGETLGSGAFAQVRAVQREQKAPVGWPDELAVKLQEFGDLSPKADARASAAQEVRALRLASGHRNVVRFCEANTELSRVWIVMERCDMRLLQYLEDGAGGRFLTECSWANVLAQMLEACAHIHSKFIVHNDLKLDNWLVRDDTLKLCDFGMASVQPKKGQLKSPRGTAPYMSPEMLRNEGYGAPADIFAVGVTAYLVLYGAFPYQGKTSYDMRKAIRDGTEQPSFQRASAGLAAVSEGARAFCEALLRRDPKDRPCANNAVSLEFLGKTTAKDLPSLRPTLDSAALSGCFQTSSPRQQHGSGQ